ncbi:hypothetical protein GCM10007063_26830 [Lentibacillus kapialis]|uniref:ComG operon protein 7 n=1 Tax=Lentibacillus kapialis TaxID=340214 RepID=A0A917PZR4_9BACI|nr:competence type IV pilus minor pilin ComGG [Lentibacillus kapialis]GGK03253.1 hypothetical protein GCM10007063_26830 [Lentibacillus kapialis]
MRKILSFTTNQQGFVFPYVLFFIALAFIILTANVNIYQDEIRITQNQTEQLKIETLIQMARGHLKDELADKPDTGTIEYEFPYGDVTAHYVKLHHQTYHLYVTCQTDNGATYQIINQMRLNSE